VGSQGCASHGLDFYGPGRGGGKTAKSANRTPKERRGGGGGEEALELSFPSFKGGGKSTDLENNGAEGKSGRGRMHRMQLMDYPFPAY